ncbi:hypothetical protein [Chryseobacterium echinoideorum]|uniref:hypothetical protein n=1 Tax=Chryseobacterium echinoideorum TaxID=1549648 RepID=UPI0011856CCA|nr:hypothetical protein [Chryseobacterium echinoideorum]
MKKIVISIISIIVLIIISITVYWNLPIEITRRSDIQKGNEIVQNIENYKASSGKLPEVNDWQTLEKLGLEKDEATKPIYQKDESENYELYYPDGFDGPYLIYISQEKKWSIDYPKITSQ